MKFSHLAVIGGILIQQYVEATFGPKFGPKGAPMKPYKEYPMPFHKPFSMSPVMTKPPLGPMVASKFDKPKRFPPPMWPVNTQTSYRQMIPSFGRPMPSQNMMFLQIPAANRGIRPFQLNPYGYGRQMNMRIPYNPGEAYLYQGRNDNNNIYERYQNTGYSDNSFAYNVRNYNRDSNLNTRRPDIPTFNTGAWNYFANTGKSLSHRNWNEPRLREVIDSANRIQISTNSLESKAVDGSVKTRSMKEENDFNVKSRLSGKTIDLSGSTFISSSKSLGSKSLSANTLDKNKVDDKPNVNIIKFKGRSIKNKNNIDLTNLNTSPNLKKRKGLDPASALGGSFIDLSNIRGKTKIFSPDQSFVSSMSVSSSVTSDAQSSSTSTRDSSTFSTAFGSSALRNKNDFGSAASNNNNLNALGSLASNNNNLNALGSLASNNNNLNALGSLASNNNNLNALGSLASNNNNLNALGSLASNNNNMNALGSLASNNNNLNAFESSAFNNNLDAFGSSASNGNNLNAFGQLGSNSNNVKALAPVMSSSSSNINSNSNMLASNDFHLHTSVGPSITDVVPSSANPVDLIGLSASNAGKGLNDVNILTGKSGSGFSNVNALAGVPGSGFGDVNALPSAPGAGFGEVNAFAGSQGAGFGDVNVLPDTPGSGFGDVNTLAGAPRSSFSDVNALAGMQGANFGDINALVGMPGSSIGDIGTVSNTIDLTTGISEAGNAGGIGAVDVLTLDKNAFTQLEQALQSGQTVSSTLLDSIIGGAGTGASSTGTVNGGTAASGVSIADAVSPQIYILDGAQAKQLAGSGRFAKSGVGSHVIDSHHHSSATSASQTSKSAHQSLSSHTVANIPHAEKVIPGGHSNGGGHPHEIVGVVGEPVGSFAGTDIMGLFSMPEGKSNSLQNIPSSVSSIPKSIGQRMVHTGGHAHHAEMSTYPTTFEVDTPCQYYTSM